MTTISQILEGLTDNYTSTGTLSRILQSAEHANENPDDIDEDEDEVDYYEDETAEEQKQQVVDGNAESAAEQPKKKKRSLGPRVDRILEDDDFIPELRLKNEHLMKYLTLERLEAMLDYILIEPNVITDSPQRCYKLPFVATEAFCMDSEHIKNSIFPTDPSQPTKILDKLFSFVTIPPIQASTGAINFVPSSLNHTLGGYFNKIVSFWLIKEPQKMLEYIINKRSIVSSMFDHHLWGLTTCITDVIVRICTVRDIQELDPTVFKALRQEILQHCINSLEQNFEDDFVTEQVFEILTSIVRKCYQMYQPREFFDQMMSPFILQHILQFTFSNHQASGSLTYGMQTASKQGCQFLRILFYNMFIAEPAEALQDIMEINFGFQLASVAGVSVEQIKAQKQEAAQEESKEAVDPSLQAAADESSKPQQEDKGNAAKKEEKEASTNSEFSAMRQEELLKERLMAGVTRIYDLIEVNPLLAQQIATFLPRFEQLFIMQQMGGQGLQVSTRVKLYELLETLVSLDNLIVNIAIKDRRFTEFIMDDYELFDNNSSVLSQLNKVIIAMARQSICFDMKVKLFKGIQQQPQQLQQSQQLLFRLAKKLSISEYSATQSKRKDIYAFIHLLVKQLQQVCEQQAAVKRLLSDCEPSWTALRKALEEEESNLQGEWGQRTFPELPKITGRAEDVVRRHEEKQAGLNLMDKGASSTTKKIIASSVQSRKKMMMFDDALN